MTDAPNTCGSCRHWNFKVSNGHAFGLCLNEKVQKAVHISLSKCDVSAHTKNEIQRWAQVLFEEHTFGCIYHEVDEVTNG